MTSHLYLASQSPRRRELLTQLGVQYELLLADAGEDAEALEAVLPGESPDAYVQRVCALKADAALQRRLRRGLPDAPVLTSDTTVCLGGDILGKPADADDMAPPAPLQLELSPVLAAALGEQPAQEQLKEVVVQLRDEYGVPVPLPKARVVPALAEDEYRLTAFGARLASGRLRTDARLRPARVPASGNKLPGFFPPMAGDWVQDDGPDTLPPGEVLCLHARGALQRRLGSFIGIQETSNLFGRMQRDYPDLVKEMLRVVAPQRVSDVLRRLAEEGIPVRNLRDAFEAITDVGGREKDVVLLTEYVRVALKREIADRYADAERSLHVLLIHPELEDKLRQSVRVAGGASQLAIAPELAARLAGEVRSHLARQPEGVRPVLLCSLDVRRHLRKLLEVDFFDLPVLSYQELAPDLRIVQAGQVNA